MARKKKNTKNADQLSLFDLDSPDEPNGYTTDQVANVTGLSLRQVDTWTSAGIVSASVVAGRGSGTTRYYSYRDILELNVAKKLKAIGQSREKIIENFAYVRDELKASVYNSILVCVDDKKAVITDKESVLTLASNLDKTGKGQGILNLNILNLSEIKKEVDNKLDNLGLEQEFILTTKA